MGVKPIARVVQTLVSTQRNILFQRLAGSAAHPGWLAACFALGMAVRVGECYAAVRATLS